MIAILLFLILLAIAAPRLLLQLALLIAWPLDMVLLVVRAPLWALGALAGFFIRRVLPVLQTWALWIIVGLLVADMGGHLVLWAIYGMPAHPFN